MRERGNEKREVQGSERQLSEIDREIEIQRREIGSRENRG